MNMITALRRISMFRIDYINIFLFHVASMSILFFFMTHSVMAIDREEFGNVLQKALEDSNEPTMQNAEYSKSVLEIIGYSKSEPDDYKKIFYERIELAAINNPQNRSRFLIAYSKMMTYRNPQSLLELLDYEVSRSTPDFAFLEKGISILRYSLATIDPGLMSDDFVEKLADIIHGTFVKDADLGRRFWYISYLTGFKNSIQLKALRPKIGIQDGVEYIRVAAPGQVESLLGFIADSPWLTPQDLEVLVDAYRKRLELSSFSNLDKRITVMYLERIESIISSKRERNGND